MLRYLPQNFFGPKFIVLLGGSVITFDGFSISNINYSLWIAADGYSFNPMAFRVMVGNASNSNDSFYS